MYTPRSQPDPAAMHLQWLQRRYDEERMSPTKDPALLDKLLQQMEATNNAMLGIVTPPKTGDPMGHRRLDGSPGYKLPDTGALGAPAVQTVTEKMSNQKIGDLGTSFNKANNHFRLTLDTTPAEAMRFLSRLSHHFAKAVPHGPVLEELLKRTIPLEETDPPAGAARDLENGRQPPYVTARLLLAGKGIGASGGGSDAYLADLRSKRNIVSALLSNAEFLMLDKTFAECLLHSCSGPLCDLLGTCENSLQLAVELMTVLGRTDSKILREAYASLLQPVRVPGMGAMSQPQQVVMWLKAAYEARMDLAGRVGMNTAMLSYLMLMPGIPVGKGDMAHVFAEMKAECEGYLSSDEEKTHEAVVAFIDEKLLRPLEQKHWNGTWKSVEPANPVAAYAADASPESSASAAAKSAGAEAPTVNDKRPVCHKWQQGQECKHDPCEYAHPNGRSKCDKGDEVCAAWFTVNGCSSEQCPHKHPNGKSARGASKGRGTFNKRNLTPMGKRHTPSDEIVPVDPTAAAAHERNRNPRLRVRDPQSD
jgi:hypothetical protein